jgi:hypothetical protein
MEASDSRCVARWSSAPADRSCVAGTTLSGGGCGSHGGAPRAQGSGSGGCGWRTRAVGRRGSGVDRALKRRRAALQRPVRSIRRKESPTGKLTGGPAINRFPDFF